MTAILPLKDVGDPTKPEGDIFGAEDLNKIYRAMVYVLRVLTDTQASIRPDTIYIGADKTAGLKRDPDTGQLVIFDSVGGEVRLAGLGTVNFASPPYLGDLVVGNSSTAPTANRMYLRYATSLKAETLLQIIGHIGIGLSGNFGSVMGAVYDPAGDLLSDTPTIDLSDPVAYANVIVPLSTPINLAAGDGVWLGLIFNATQTYPVVGNSVGGHNAKYVDVGSFSVPNPIAIPGTFATVFVPAIAGRIAGGVPFDFEV